MASRISIIPTPVSVTELGGTVVLRARGGGSGGGGGGRGVVEVTVAGVAQGVLDSVFGEQGVVVASGSRVRMCAVDGAGGGGGEGGGVPQVVCRLDGKAVLVAGGYRLYIDGGVAITAGDAAGVRHALVTLKHLVAAHGVELPRAVIDDAPRFAVRGVMLDVSRDRVPTMAEMRRIVGQLADLKINHLQFYTEHTFAYAGHEKVWQGWSPLTGAEIREIDGWCRGVGIELAANQNCFGHLAHWLRMPEYQHLAETHGDWMFDVWPRSGPFSLCPTDVRSVELVRDLLGQLVPNFSSGLVNIGADETYDIAYGRSAEAVRERGRAAVYLEFVREICKVAAELGRRPMFWADIALHEPGCIPQIPAELLSLAWGYEPHSPFAEWTRLLRGAGRDVWVCPGTSSWRSIFGRSAERNANLNAAGACAVAAGQPGADGYLICDWGDTGHHQQWPVALHAVAHGAQAAWTGATGAGHAEAIGAQCFGDAATGAWLERLGDCDLPLRQVAGRLSRPKNEGEFALWNQSALFADLHNCPWADRTEVGGLERWKAAQDVVADLGRGVPVGAGALVTRELRHTLAVAQLAADRAVLRRERPGDAACRGELGERVRGLMTEHTALWGERSRPGGLEHSNSFWQKVIDTTVQA